MAFWKKQNNSSQTFADLVRGLQHSVNAAMEMLEARNIELLGRYFDQKGNALTRRLRIGEDTAIDIPIISKVNPSAMNIKEVEMEFDIQIIRPNINAKPPRTVLWLEIQAIHSIRVSNGRASQ